MKTIKIYEDFKNREWPEILDDIKELSAEEVTNLLRGLVLYFKEEQDILLNMDAIGIAKDLMAAVEKLNNRTGD